MANISFANLKQTFEMWRDEIDNHATDKTPTAFATLTASDHIVTIGGTGFDYQNGVPRNGHVDSLEIKLGGQKEFADIAITGIDTDFINYAQMVSTPTPIDRTMAMWAATLGGDDTIDFGPDKKGALTIDFAGDGYEAPNGRAGGDDTFSGDVFEGLVAGDFFSVGAGREASGGDDIFELSNSRQATLVGDVYQAATGSRFVAGNDSITLDYYAYVSGDAYSAFGEFVAGNDTLWGSDENDNLSGDVYTAGATASIRFGNDEIHGGDGSDLIWGDYAVNASTKYSGGNDRIFGDAGDDELNGQEGSDTLDGGTGNDTVNGGYGDDIVRGGAGKDTMNGSVGSDTADYRDKTVSVEIRLDDTGSGPARVGGVIEDQLDQFENLIGGAANDKFIGYAEYNDNVFEGRGGSDTLNGGGGRDTLVGGAGKDKLVGGMGRDHFVFNAKLGTTNVDKIVDFTHRTDKIVLDDAIFRALGDTFDKSDFVALADGHSATRANQHVIYDKSNGSLWYDSDGRGGHAAVKFAQLGNAHTHPETLDWHDFAIV